MIFLENYFSRVQNSLVDTAAELYRAIPTLATQRLASTPTAPTPSNNQPSPLKDRLTDFKRVFESEALKGKFNEYLDHVFLQLDAPKFFNLMSDILKKDLSYEETYQELLNRIGEAKRGRINSFFDHRRANQSLFRTVAGQIGRLLGRNATINGYAEIGTTGGLIRPLKAEKIKLRGPKIVIAEKRKLLDYFVTGIPLPYDLFIPSDGKKNPISGKIDRSSLELVTCLTGIQGIPENKVRGFIQSVHEVLKPEGSFIVRAYNVDDPDLKALVNVIQSVSNAVIGTSLQTEVKETRNFQPLTSWIELIEENGFKYESGFFRTEGDPTQNALLQFTKIPKTESEAHFHEMEKALKEKNRDATQEQTYLTTFEGHLMSLAREYADFIKTKPIHEFPFFSQIRLLGKVFIDTCRDAIRASSFGQVMTSEYMLRNFFLLVSTTLGLMLKGLVYAPLALIKVRNPQGFDPLLFLKNDAEEYAQTLEQAIPSSLPYFKKLWELWKGFIKAPHRGIINTYLTAITTMEYLVKGVISASIKMDRKQNSSKRSLMIEDRYRRVHSALDPRIEIIKHDPEFKLKAIEIPRFPQLKEVLLKLAEAEAKIATIAGQKKVQVKVKVPIEGVESLKALKGSQILGEIPILTDPSHRYVRLDVDVAELSSVIKTLEASEAEISYIHDF